jgi:LPS export ABC transporter protein LptC
LKSKSNIFLLNIAVLVAAIFFSCRDRSTEIQEISKKYEGPMESAFDISVFYTDSAQPKIHLQSPEVNRYKHTDKPYTEYPKGLYVEFFDEAGGIKSTLKANYAIQWESEGITEAKSDVVVVNQKGEMLNTEHLIWDEAKEKIYTEEFVKITTEDQQIMGYGFEADQEFNSYLVRNIKGTINIKDD